VLTAEAEGVQNPRTSKLFAYSSPTDKTVRLIDQFWDATLHKVPNRAAVLQEMLRTGQLRHTPPREVVLDRETQHLSICPDSRGLVRKMRLVAAGGLAAVAGWTARTLWTRQLSAVAVPVVSAAIAYLADKLRRTFYFSKTAALRDRDLKKIPTHMWLDPL
jgi:hypothetical protein